MPEAFLYGWDTNRYRRLIVDAAGHLQVDVITAGGTASHCMGWTGAAWTPMLVESLANANLRTRLYDGVNPIVSVGTGADIADVNRGLFTQAGVRGWDGAFWKSVNAEDNPLDALSNDRVSLSGISKLYGYNGATWSRLRVESDALFNLRVKLYDGANGITSELFGQTTINPGDRRGLDVRTQLYLYRDATHGHPWKSVYPLADGDNGITIASTGLFGFNGATWDRLRSYPTGILKVGRAEVGLLTVRRVAVGQVGAAGARKLYWMLLNPSAGNSAVELADAAAPGGVIVADHFDTARDGHMITFDPPMEFTTGLYLETSTNMTSITFGYL